MFEESSVWRGEEKNFVGKKLLHSRLQWRWSDCPEAVMDENPAPLAKVAGRQERRQQLKPTRLPLDHVLGLYLFQLLKFKFPFLGLYCKTLQLILNLTPSSLPLKSSSSPSSPRSEALSPPRLDLFRPILSTSAQWNEIELTQLHRRRSGWSLTSRNPHRLWRGVFPLKSHRVFLLSVPGFSLAHHPRNKG